MKIFITKSIVFLFVFLTTYFSPVYINGQIYMGFSSGISIPDEQDLKFINYDHNNNLKVIYSTNDVDGNLSFLNNVSLSYWDLGKSFSNFGVKLDYSEWAYYSVVEDFQSDIAVPFNSVEQERISIILSILSKFYFTFLNDKNTDSRITFVYFGLGAGIVKSEVKYGNENLGIGYQLLSGVSYSLIANLYLVGEFSFTIAPDVDAAPKPGWQVHTSGTKTPFRLGPHNDTRFFGMNLGFNYRIY